MGTGGSRGGPIRRRSGAPPTTGYGIASYRDAMSLRVAALPVDLLSLANALEGCALTIDGAVRRLGTGRAEYHSSAVASLARTARSVEASVVLVARRLGAADAPGGTALRLPTIAIPLHTAPGYSWSTQLTGPLSDGDPRNDVLRVAASQLGVREHGRNINDYGDWFGANGVFWCAEFVSWVFAHAGHPLPISIGARKGASGFAYCQYGRDEAYKRSELFSRPRPGDVFFHFRRGDRGAGHTGIVVDVLPDGRVVTIEGNAAPRNGRDGGGVVKQTRSLAYSRRLTFWRVFPQSPEDDRGPDDMAPRPSTIEPRRRRTRRRSTRTGRR